MPDISMCRNMTCPSRMGCYRFRAIPNDPRQAWMSFAPEKGEDKCKSFDRVKLGDRVTEIDCEGVTRTGSGCSKNNNCTYPVCNPK